MFFFSSLESKEEKNQLMILNAAKEKENNNCFHIQNECTQFSIGIGAMFGDRIRTHTKPFNEQIDSKMNFILIDHIFAINRVNEVTGKHF